MQEELITLQTAILAKEKGFTENVINYYHIHEGLTESVLINEIDILLKNYKTPYEVRRNWNTINTEFCYVENFSAPTQSLLQKWLREIHDIKIRLVQRNIKYLVFIQLKLNEEIRFEGNSYEEALEIGLQEGLKLIK